MAECTTPGGRLSTPAKGDSKETALKAGTSVRRITPPRGVPMGGFAFRDHGCEQVRDDLWVRCLWLEAGDHRVVILALDVHALELETVQAWKADIATRWGVPPGAVLINTSHTHSGPLMVERFYGSASPDPHYGALIKGRVLEAVEEASRLEENCSLAFGRAALHLGISRRRPGDSGGVVMAPYPAGHVERDLPVLRVCDARGAPLCVAFSAAAHPSILADYLISAEYPGAACRLVEQALGGRTMALFLQGAGGEVKVNTNADVAGGKWLKGTAETVQRAGRTVADAVLAALAADALQNVEPVLTAASGTVVLPLALPSDAAAFFEQWRRGVDQGFPGGSRSAAARAWADYHAARLAQGIPALPTVECPVQVLHLARNVEIVAVAGELTSGLAQTIRNGLPQACPILLGYTNGSIGYLPTEIMLREGGYEALDSVFYFRTLPAPFAPGLEAALVAGINALRQRV